MDVDMGRAPGREIELNAGDQMREQKFCCSP
jgi:hypothetical protein